MQAQRQHTPDQRAKFYGEHIDCDPHDILEPFRLLGADLADKKAAFELIDDMKKIIIAQQKGRTENDYIAKHNKAPTEAYLERMAYSSPEYLSIVKDLDKARREYLIAQANYTAEDKRIELLRSLESSARSQLNKLPGST